MDSDKVRKKGRKSANLPQTYAEMLRDGQKRKSTRFYRQESAEFADHAISDLVTMSAVELAKVADNNERFDLQDTEKVKERTIIYMKSCGDTCNTPTMMGLARSFGMTVQAFDKLKRTHPEHPTTQWLAMVHDEFARITYAAAQKNLTNPVVSIFGLKAMFQWKDIVTLEATPPSDPLESQKTPDEIAQKYRFLQGNV